jgi:hypothetical protein
MVGALYHKHFEPTKRGPYMLWISRKQYYNMLWSNARPSPGKASGQREPEQAVKHG